MPTPAALSVAIPAHNEAHYIGACIESVLTSAQQAGQPVEVVVALNRCTDGTRAVAESLGARCVEEPRKCIAAVRNAAVRAGTASAIATIDADSRMSPGTVAAVLSKVHDSRYIGGGAWMQLERMSVGIAFSLIRVAPHLARNRVSCGMFWCLRDTFEALDGFDERLVSAEDLDLALRMKALGQQRGLRYGTIWRHGITTSSRKFDQFGDWYLFKNPRLVKQIFSGQDRAAADHFYYDINR
jgi:glycosyltransferase involved in cell wall biosynthesis